MAATPAPPNLSYTPPSSEERYYDALFAEADRNRAGYISGPDAVSFLSRSKLPLQLLKNIWTMADQNPKTNSLDRFKFNIAVRLIQLYQNGQKAQGANLASQEGVVLRPPYFEGIDSSAFMTAAPATAPAVAAPVASVPQPTVAALPPPSQQNMAVNQQPSTRALAPAQDPYAMQPHEQSRYEALFPTYDKNNDGFVYGSEAVALFSRSGVPKDQLREIWNMVDEPVDNRLSKLEFAIAMHLIVCVSKKNLPCPDTLPPSLKALKGRDIPGSPTRMASSAPPSGMPSPVRAQPSPYMQPKTAYVPPSPGSAYQTNMPQGTNSLTPSFGQTPSYVHPDQQPSAEPSSGMALGQSGKSTMSTEGGRMAISEAFDSLSLETNTVSTYGVHQTDEGHYTAGAHTDQQQHYIPPSAAAPASEHPPTDIHRTFSPTSMASHDKPQHLQSTEEASAKAAAAELSNLRKVLQQLQAENVSLRAQLGSMSDEEKGVRKEISSTVAEIGALSKELATIRTQVSDAKAQLIEATSELKMHQEKKASLNDLLNDAKATRDALQTASQNINEYKENQTKQQQPAYNYNADNEVDLFGFNYEPPPQPAPVPSHDHASEHPPSNPGKRPSYNESHPMTTSIDVSPQHVSNEHTIPNVAPPANDMPPPPPVPVPESQMIPMGGMPMGGYAENNPTTANIHPESFGHTVAPPTNAPSKEDLETMKRDAVRAREIAENAKLEEIRVTKKAEEFEAAADKAEKEVQELQTALDGKKKGFRKSKMQKEFDKSSLKASELRKKAVEAQTHVQSAQSAKVNAEREAEALTQQLEQAEFNAAAAESYQDTIKHHPEQYNNGNMGHLMNGNGTITYPAAGKQQENVYDNPFSI